MTIKISENIKRLRRNKNVTQEQIAEMLGVSVTAVSKWERGETYPDITMLFPLARYFGVSLDELMGYDEAKEKAEIHALRMEYREIYKKNGEKAREFIENVYRRYPDNYFVMHDYMWNKAGDYADNDPAVLLDNKEEFLSICRKILDGCNAENLRLDAYSMQAKILHAEGKTEEALALYREKFPSWFMTWEQKSEQLFAKNTPEFRRMLLLNLYELTRFALDKKIKEIWFCGDGTPAEKAAKGFALCDAIAKLREKTGDRELVLAEYYLLVCQLNEIRRFGGNEADLENYRERKRKAAALVNEYTKDNPAAKEHIRYMYGKETV
ncbi:MAG: helix-turn-helix transcriptional regulator [Clostridia bacterium]|nr:helix-turn-helix transcriptional regulator [Clostridia bacterium]